MSQLTYTDILRMEDVLADTRHILAEAEQVARGEKVKITFYPEDGKEPFSHCYPPRVAAYGWKMLGTPAPVVETTRISFTSGGCTIPHRPTVDSYRAFIQVLLARACAEQRRTSRKLRKNIALSLKGGQSQ